MSESNLSQIGRFYDTTQAHIIRGKLEAHGIRCFLFDGNHAAAAWNIIFAIGGIRLMVLKQDIEKACQILEEECRSPYAFKQEKQWIKRPLFRTFIGTLVGLIAGAPSTRPKRKADAQQDE